MVNRFIRAFVASALVLSAVHPLRGQEKTPGDIYKTAGPSVVLIETYGEDGKVSGSGSGFLVSADGRILTNFHVIAHTKRATVRLANEDAYDTVRVLNVDKRKDIALLKIDAVSLPWLKLGHWERYR
jgi:S1-C subfamily serine protease